MRRIALTAALCLWAGGALAGQKITTPGGPTVRFDENGAIITAPISQPGLSQVYMMTEPGPQLQKQLDAIQTQLKCVWVSLFTEVIDGRPVSPMANRTFATKCNDAFQEIEPK